MDQKFVGRVKTAMEKRGINTYAELSQRSDVAPNSITRWLEKGELPRGSSILALANGLNVSVDWLRTGEGPMDISEPLAALSLPDFVDPAPDVRALLRGAAIVPSGLLADFSMALKNFETATWNMANVIHSAKEGGGKVDLDALKHWNKKAASAVERMHSLEVVPGLAADTYLDLVGEVWTYINVQGEELPRAKQEAVVQILAQEILASGGKKPDVKRMRDLIEVVR